MNQQPIVQPNSIESHHRTAVVRDIHCVGIDSQTTDDSMGRWLDKTFPENAQWLKTEFDAGRLEPGRIFVCEPQQTAETNNPGASRLYFNLALRTHWRAEPRAEVLESCIQELADIVLRFHVNEVAIYRFDASPTAQAWEDVKLNILTAFARIPQIRLRFIDNPQLDENPKQVTVFTDGSAQPNPGPGGYGVILRFGNSVREIAQGFRYTTNNRMELLAAIVGLEALKEPCQVRLYSDSRYIIDGVVHGHAGRWRAKGWKHGKAKNADLWERFLRVYVRHQVELIWVKGHSGIADNERCDQLANAASSAADLANDEGFEESVKRLIINKKLEPVLRPKPQTSSRNANGNQAPQKRNWPKPKQPGDPCRYCGQPLDKRDTRKSNPTSAFYYEWYLYCNPCKKMYHVDAAKVFRDKT